MVQYEIVADGAGYSAFRRGRPVQLVLGLARADTGAPCLAAGKDRDVEAAGDDLVGGRVDEGLRALAAHGGVRGLLGGEAELLSDEVRRVAVTPGQQVHDADGLRVG